MNVRQILLDARDQGVAGLSSQDPDSIDHEGELAEAVAQTQLDLYHAVARALGFLDEASSGSRQHYIETGAYLLEDEVITS